MTDKNISANGKKVRLQGIILLYFIGVLSGVILYCFPVSGQAGRLETVAQDFILGRLDKRFMEVMINSFCEPFVMLLVCFFLGFSSIAHFAEYLVPVFHAFGTGVTLAGIYDMYGVKGVAMSAVMIIPGTVISAFAIIIAAREALNMSSDICSVSFRKSSIGTKIDFRLYFTKYVILCVMLVIAAFVESTLILLFADLWQINV